MSFVLSSGSNIDRLVSLYRATKRTGKLFVIDLYQYYLLQELKFFSSRLPPHHNDHLRVLFTCFQANKLAENNLKNILYKAKSRKIERYEIYSNPATMVLRLSLSEQRKLAKNLVNTNDLSFLYSMWSGYLKKDDTMLAFPRQYNKEWFHIHTSGHAWLEDLQQLTKKINPGMIIPVHTLQADKFSSLFDNVVRKLDGEEVIL